MKIKQDGTAVYVLDRLGGKQIIKIGCRECELVAVHLLSQNTRAAIRI